MDIDDNRPILAAFLRFFKLAKIKFFKNPTNADYCELLNDWYQILYRTKIVDKFVVGHQCSLSNELAKRMTKSRIEFVTVMERFLQTATHSLIQEKERLGIKENLQVRITRFEPTPDGVEFKIVLSKIPIPVGAWIV